MARIETFFIELRVSPLSVTNSVPLRVVWGL